MIVNISIGNSDDRLLQAEWFEYCNEVDHYVRTFAGAVHGEYYSSPRSKYQNACWTFEVNEHEAEQLRHLLTETREGYGQHSIAWLEGETQFI